MKRIFKNMQQIGTVLFGERWDEAFFLPSFEGVGGGFQ